MCVVAGSCLCDSGATIPSSSAEPTTCCCCCCCSGWGLQAGLQQRVDSGLLQGWVPTGALKAMKALQKALEQQQA